MFIGHYAVGFLLKKRFKEIPLWLLFIAVQFVDILTFILVLLGIERISYNPTSNPFLRTLLEYVPFTHSLSSSLVIAFVVFLIFWKFKNKIWGTALSIGVLSHWFIDVIAHTPDLPLVWNSFKVGLGLWNFPWLAFLIEVGFFIGAGYYLYKDSKNIKRPVILIALAIILYTPTMFAPEGEVPVAVVSIMSLSLYAIFPALAYWIEKKKLNNKKLW
ncbi:hypothetical protein ACFLY8_04700 [Halobacteriota archaeon]